MDAPDQVSRFKIWTEINISFYYYNDLTELYDIKSQQ